jgi:hypothetical protein
MNLPRVPGNANDRDGTAGDPNRDIDILNYDAQEPKEGGHRGSACRLNAVAALNRTGGAFSALVGGCCGNSGQSECDDESELHADLIEDGR